MPARVRAPRRSRRRAQDRGAPSPNPEILPWRRENPASVVNLEKPTPLPPSCSSVCRRPPPARRKRERENALIRFGLWPKHPYLLCGKQILYTLVGSRFYILFLLCNIMDHGLDSEQYYQYQGTDTGKCDIVKVNKPVVRISGYILAPPNNEDYLLKSVNRQPVAVYIDASGTAFQHYESGVFSGDCGTDLMHTVTVIGYGTNKDGTKYWLLKNSWGEGWGEKGYMRILRNANPPYGLCGIAMSALFPVA